MHLISQLGHKLYDNKKKDDQHYKGFKKEIQKK